jgi:hypothetical protein
MATVEAALAIAALVVVVGLAVGGLAAMSAQLRCVDAAREGARLAARGDERAAADAAQKIGPGGAVLQLRQDGDYVIARVSTRSAVLPALAISAESVAALEPDVAGPR